MTLDGQSTVSCAELVSFIRSNYDNFDCRSQIMVVAESLMRTFEIKQQLPCKFQKSKNRINWVSASSNEASPETYFDVASTLTRVARDFDDLRFINTTLKILDSKGAGFIDTDTIRAECLAIIDELAND